MKIVLIEDHKLIRDMLMVSCRQAVPKASVTGATSLAEGLAVCRKLNPELIFLDLELPDGDGLDFLPQLTAAAPGAKIILLTSYADEFTLHRALRSQVHGFVDKTEQPLDVLKEAISMVMAGQQYFSTVAQRLKSALKSDPEAFSKLLTDREQDLMRLLGQGLTNEQIAERTGLTATTVKGHRRNIMGKLGFHSTIELMQYAADKGFARLKRSSVAV